LPSGERAGSPAWQKRRNEIGRRVQAAKLGSSRVLEDSFAVISYAAVVPKGNEGWLGNVSDFIEEAKASGLVTRTIESAALRGVQVAPSKNPASP